MISVDIYLNETTRHADVILPPPSALQKSHYDVALLQLRRAQRGQLQPAGAAPRPEAPDEWEILAAGPHRPGRRPEPTPPWSTTSRRGLVEGRW
jgi:anaerobic selenocysteine-containing dehydrogenase